MGNGSEHHEVGACAFALGTHEYELDDRVLVRVVNQSPTPDKRSRSSAPSALLLNRLRDGERASTQVDGKRGVKRLAFEEDGRDLDRSFGGTSFRRCLLGLWSRHAPLFSRPRPSYTRPQIVRTFALMSLMSRSRS